VFGDVGQPQLVRAGGCEVPLDKVVLGRLIRWTPRPLPGPWQAFEAQLAHDLPHQLLVDDDALLDL
jgi:hypothetical protein